MSAVKMLVVKLPGTASTMSTLLDDDRNLSISLAAFEPGGGGRSSNVNCLFPFLLKSPVPTLRSVPLNLPTGVNYRLYSIPWLSRVPWAGSFICGCTLPGTVPVTLWGPCLVPGT